MTTGISGIMFYPRTTIGNVCLCAGLAPVVGGLSQIGRNKYRENLVQFTLKYNLYCFGGFDTHFMFVRNKNGLFM